MLQKLEISAGLTGRFSLALNNFRLPYSGIRVILSAFSRQRNDFQRQNAHHLLTTALVVFKALVNFEHHPLHSPSSLNYNTHDEFDSADPSSMQDTCHI